MATGLGEPWCRDGGILQGCPLSMVFIVALYVPWCRRLESLPDIKPQLYADHLKCSAARPRALFESAHVTAKYVRLVGQDVSPGKCVLLSTSKAVRRAMKLLGHFGVMVAVGRFNLMLEIWVVILISLIVLELVLFLVGLVRLLLGLLRLVLCLLGFRSSWVSLGVSFFLGSVWSTRMPLANTPPILNLLDGPVDVDPAFYIVWSRFRMMRRYLAYCPEEEPRIFRMLDLISRGAQGHGPVHLLLISGAEIGFTWDSGEQGWLRVSLPPLRMMTGPIQHFRSAILDAWHFHVFSKLLYNYLTRPTCGIEIKCC